MRCNKYCPALRNVHGNYETPVDDCVLRMDYSENKKGEDGCIYTLKAIENMLNCREIMLEVSKGAEGQDNG